MDKTIKTANGGTFTVSEKVFAGHTRKQFKAWIEKYHPEHLWTWELLYPGSELAEKPTKTTKKDS